MAYTNLSNFMSGLTSYGKHAPRYLDHVGNTTRQAAYTEFLEIVNGVAGYDSNSYTNLTGLLSRLAYAGNDVQGQLDHESKATRSAAATELQTLMTTFALMEGLEGLSAGDYTNFTDRFVDLMSAPNNVYNWSQKVTSSQMAAANTALLAFATQAAKIPIDVHALIPDLWMDAGYDSSLTMGGYDGTATSTGTEEDRVEEWTNKLNSDHAFTAAVDVRPTYQATGVGGKPAIAFDKTVGQYLTRAARMFTGTTHTTILVGQITTGNTTSAAFWGQTVPSHEKRFFRCGRRADSADRVPIINTNNNTTSDRDGRGSTTLPYSEALLLTYDVYQAFDDATNNNRIRYKGAEETITSAVGCNAPGDITGATHTYIGGTIVNNALSHGLYGLIAELLIWNSSLSTAQIESVEAWLAAKYGITLS